MKSFLVKNKKPIIKWGLLPDNIFFEGDVPDGYSLAVCPSKGFIIIDVDTHKDINGFDNIPRKLQSELNNTLNYPTKNNGRHYWFKYTGNVNLMNKTSNLGIDLRTHRGYVVWYPDIDVRNCMKDVQSTTNVMNEWLESIFYKIKNKKMEIKNETITLSDDLGVVATGNVNVEDAIENLEPNGEWVITKT